MKRLLLSSFFLLSFFSCSQHLVAPQTTRAQREQFKRELIANTIESALAQPLTPANAPKLESAFWGMGLARYTSEKTTNAIRYLFTTWNLLSPSTQRAMLEVVYAVYPDAFLSETRSIVTSTSNEKLFAMAGLHQLRATKWSEHALIVEPMQKRFHHHAAHPILRMLTYDIQQSLLDTKPSIPSLADLLHAPIRQGYPVIFSLQRKNRIFSGLAIVRDASGRFVKSDDSTAFSIPQLALASSNLPGYLTNGNTPQGIFSVQGFGRSKNAFIGPTENVQMVLPFEVKPFEFFHTSDTDDSVWTVGRYEDLLPASWRGYLPIYTAFYAGEAGRTEIIAHGTTIDPDFYRGEPYFPNAPTLGCLSAVESWSPESGERMSSDQQRLIDMMKRIGFEKGFLVVVELNDEQRHVTFNDVLPFLQ